MKLHWKTLLIIGITSFLLIAFLYAISSAVILSGFRNIEEQNVRKNVERADEALSNDIDGLNTISRDYAGWDDTYNFINDANENYIKTNLVKETFKNLHIHIILFYNSSGSLIYGKAYDFINDRDIPVPNAFNRDLPPDNYLINFNDTEDTHKGIILLDEGTMLIASQPILTSERKGPIRGTLIFGHYLNHAEVQRLSDITHLTLNISSLDSNELKDLHFSENSFSDPASIVVHPQTDKSIAGYDILKDIYGNPAMLLHVEMPRPIYDQGVISTRYLFFSLITIGLTFSGLSLWFLEKMVLRRLDRLNSDVTGIASSRQSTGRIKIEGDDELSNLGGSINKMLDSLSNAEDELRKHRDRLESEVEIRTRDLKAINEQLEAEIVERRRAEKLTEEALKEKETLLREIHHRVKNNLQIISSLLNHQMDNIQDKKVLDIFTESQNRISSMSLIHEKLYRSTDLRNIDFKEYIYDLGTNLQQSYDINSGSIRMNMNIEKISLDIDFAIPIGLILTEMITNSLKYAFPDGREGEIYISFKSTNDNIYELVVGDNGIGIPKDLDIRKTTSLGLHLVTMLSEKQLRGTINMNCDKGTEFQIKFKGN